MKAINLTLTIITTFFLISWTGESSEASAENNPVTTTLKEQMETPEYESVENVLTIVNAKLSKEDPIEDMDTGGSQGISSIGKCNASSTLSPQGNSKYNTSNISDMDMNTAWVEGEPKYGIGVKLTFEMTAHFFGTDDIQIYEIFMIATGKTIQE